MDGFLPTFTRRKLFPPTFRESTWSSPVSRLEKPERVIIPLQESPGAPYQANISEGQSVLAGQNIGVMGEAPACLSVHASIAGTVDKIAPMHHPLGFQAISALILSNGKEGVFEYNPLGNKCSSGNGREVLLGLQELGVPLDYGRLLPAESTVSSFFINATEFEPYFTSKHLLLREHLQEVINGLKILMEACTVETTVVIVEKAFPEITARIEEAARETKGLLVKTVSRPYPDTATRSLVRRFPTEKPGGSSGSTAFSVVPVDLASLVATNRAWTSGEPFIDQLISIAGSAVSEQKNAWVKTGTTLDQVLTHAGGDVARLGRASLGGPLTGSPQHSTEVPITKKIKGVFAAVAFLFDEHRESRFYKQAPCVRCAKCVDVCPSSLVPNTIADFINNNMHDDAQQWGLFQCVECGLCEYACPSRIPLLEILRLGKVFLKGEECLLSRRALNSLLG